MIGHSMDNISVTPWWHHVAIMAAYTGTFEILWDASNSHWMATTGFRVVCLLLVPRRFWAALAFAELLSGASMALPMLPRFGIEWVMAVLIPAVLLCMPLVVFMQDRFPVFYRGGRIHTIRLVVISMLCAVAGAFRSSLALFVMDRVDGIPGIPVTWQIVLRYVLGGYLGALTFAPGILAIRERLRGRKEPLTWHGLMKQSLFRDVLLIELPILLGIHFLAYMVTANEGTIFFQAMIVIPIIVLSVKHGWHGTAVSGMIASIWLIAPTLGSPDLSLIPAEVILAIVISAWLIWTNRQTPGLSIQAAASASAWIAVLSLIPMQSIRHTFGPRYRTPDGARYYYDGSLIGKAST